MDLDTTERTEVSGTPDGPESGGIGTEVIAGDRSGDCETCGYWSSDIILGMCQPCRDKFGICEECE
jgi:hypothetical protein